MNMVYGAEIYDGFKRLGIVGKRVIVHSSLSSFGYVEGGADTVIASLVESFETILMPAFCWESNTAPPKEDRPLQNGCDYSFYDGWGKPLKPFIVETAGIEKSMGIISRKFISLRNTYRSDHAWHSWVSYGEKAGYLTENHSWDSTNLPIERLAGIEGYILLIGVGLASCTAIHVAEEKAGRRPFIRWAVDREGKIKRVRAAGCAKGFNNLMPYCKELFRETCVGDCKILAAPLNTFITHMTSVIVSKPELTRCSINCLRCQDAISGGPKDDLNFT